MIFTFVYWIGAICWAAFTPHNPSAWLDLRWLFVLAFAIPTSLFLWTVVFFLQIGRFSVSNNRFIAIGIASPVLYVGGFLSLVAYRDWRSEQWSRRLTNQLSEVTVGSLEDEPLLDSKGPIGVRLRYRIAYPKGLDMDAKFAPAASLYGIINTNKAVGFLVLRRVVAPPVFGIFSPGNYAITEDLLPAFMPALLLPATDSMSAPRPKTSDHCFRWSWDLKRDDIEQARAQSFSFSIYPGSASESIKGVKGDTLHTYRLSDFLSTAVQEGGLDCGK
jgi:hypothetical protein